MARTKVRIVDAPPKNNVYTGMLAMMAFSMLLGIAVLALELSDYGFAAEAKGGPTINLPKDVGRPTPGAATPSAAAAPAAPGG